MLNFLFKTIKDSKVAALDGERLENQEEIS